MLINFDTQESGNVVSLVGTKKMTTCEIDYLKIDAEGHDLAAVKSIGDVVSKIPCIQFVLCDYNIHTRGYFQDLLYFFKGHKFSLYKITTLGIQKMQSYFQSDERFRAPSYIVLYND